MCISETHIHTRARCARLKRGEKTKSVAVSLTQKTFPKWKVERAQRQNEMKEQNGCLDTEEEEEA